MSGAAGRGADHTPTEARARSAEAAFRRSAGRIDRSMLLFGAIVLAVSVLMSPDPEMLSLFGFDVPVMCGFRALTGRECMGCGLTRSFAFMGHLQPVAAFGLHKLGPILWVIIVGQVPYRGWKLWRATRR